MIVCVRHQCLIFFGDEMGRSPDDHLKLELPEKYSMASSEEEEILGISTSKMKMGHTGTGRGIEEYRERPMLAS
jgi:hypothetical protein